MKDPLKTRKNHIWFSPPGRFSEKAHRRVHEMMEEQRSGVHEFRRSTGTILILTAMLFFRFLPVAALGYPGEDRPEPVSGRPVSVEAIIPADVLARAMLLQQELELIRFEMGKPKDSRKTRMATNAQSHEVYFQALTLFIKSDRLALELTGSTGLRPRPVSPSGIRPFHAWKMVNAAYHRILTVKEELGITDSFSEKLQDSTTTPTDVGRAIVEANRQINLLLERRFSPSDVYQQVGVAIRYAASLLGQFPGATLMPKGPSLERGKQPADVFLRLVECYGRLESIAHQSGIPILHLDSTAAKQVVLDMEVRPSDVYDVATLLVSDLAYLHAQVRDARPPGIVPFPGRKFPSDVYQQAGILRAQLIALEQFVLTNPHWLDR